MKPMLAAVVLLLVQDSPERDEVAVQAARLAGEDPDAALDALSRLVDLAATRREDVEKAAASLPESAAFSRAALAEELRSRSELGDRYGTAPRVTIAAEEQSASEVLDRIVEQSGVRVDATRAWRGASPPAISLKAEDAPFLKVLREFCKAAGLMANPQGARIWLYGGMAPEGPASYFRGFEVTVGSVSRSRRVEFGGNAEDSMSIQLQARWVGSAAISAIRRVEGLDVVDDRGARLEPMPAVETPVASADRNPAVEPMVAWVACRLQPPKSAAEKLSTVRGSVVAAVAVESLRLDAKADTAAGATVSAEGFEAVFVNGVVSRGNLVVRLRPPGELSEFLDTPVGFRAALKEAGAVPVQAYARRAGNEIEYTLYLSQITNNQDEVQSVAVLVPRKLVERRIWFDLRDVPLK